MEHRRKYERKKEEKEIKERQERVKKAREEHARAQRVREEFSCVQLKAKMYHSLLQILKIKDMTL